MYATTRGQKTSISEEDTFTILTFARYCTHRYAEVLRVHELHVPVQDDSGQQSVRYL